MDGSHFDTQVRRLAAAHTRRGTLAGMSGLLAILAAARAPVAAKKKKAKKTTLCLDGQTIQVSKKKKKKLLKQGATLGACPPPPPPPSGCTPTCATTTCGGDDGCGGICGCSTGSICHNGLCKTCDLACPSGAAGCGAELQTYLDAGGPVFVCPGRYVGTFAITKNVTLVGAGDGDDPTTSTILDARGGGRVLTVNDAVTASLRGLRITGGSATEAGGIDNKGFLTMTNCAIIDNHAVNGAAGGILNYPRQLTLVGCTVAGNSATGVGGGIETYSTTTLDGCLISGNSAGGDGGGIFCHSGTTLDVKNGSRIASNEAGGNGGGIANFWVVTFDATCQVTGNTAGLAGGGLYRYGGTFTLNGATISGNDPNNCDSEFGDPDC